MREVDLKITANLARELDWILKRRLLDIRQDAGTAFAAR